MKTLIIIGPSGSGKTTLSTKLAQIYRQIFGQNTVTLISLDSANCFSQNKDIQINELITIQDIMEQYQIGPNGAILYAMDFLLQNIEWLLGKIQAKIKQLRAKEKNSKLINHLFVFDLPGQIQLYINTDTVRKIIQKISQVISFSHGTSPCIMQLFDCSYMHNISQFISLCMMSLSTMINMQMPHINILNKIDILRSAQSKPSRGLLNQYFKVTSAGQLVKQLKSSQQENLQTNADLIAKVLDTYGQVSFVPCSIYHMQLISNLIYEMETIFGTLQLSIHNKKFMEFVKDIDQFTLDRAITNMQNQFYEQQQENLDKFNNDVSQQKKQ